MDAWYLLGALAVVSLAPWVPGMPDHESRWLAGLWALGGLALTLLDNPILAVSLGLVWLSPVAAWSNMRALALPCHIRDIHCEQGAHPVIGSLVKEAMGPAIVALGTGLGILLAERWVIRAGHGDALRWGLIGLVLISLAWGCFMPSVWARANRRTQGLSGNPLHFGEMMALGFPAALALPSPWHLVMGLLTLGGVLDSRTRIAAVAVAPALMLMAPWWLAAAGGATALAVLGWRWQAAPMRENPRWVVWITAWRWIGRFPWAGIGLGAFGEVVGRELGGHPTNAWRDRWTHAHNEWLHVAVEAGIPAATGLALWGIAAGAQAWGAGQIEIVGGLAALGILMLTGYPLRVPEVAPLGLYYVARVLA